MPAHHQGRLEAQGHRNDLEVFFVDLIKSVAFLEAEEEATPRLSASDDERASAMADREAARLWRATRIATRIVLERAGGEAIRRLNFEIEAYGPPETRRSSALQRLAHRRSGTHCRLEGHAGGSRPRTKGTPHPYVR